MTFHIVPFITNHQLYIVSFICSFLFVILFTPLSILIGKKLGIVDIPNNRKVHKTIIPRTGGIAVFFSFIFTYILIQFIFELSTDRLLLYLMISISLVFLLGILDDILDLRARTKFFIQIMIALFYAVNVYKINQIHIPFFDDPIQLGLLSIPLTVFWIVFITNAFNLIDGLDGLSAGIATISSLSFFVVSLMIGNNVVSVLSIVLVGSLLGFLIFNRNPAKIFLGDSGSLFLGFLLASLSLLEMKQVVATTFITPILIFFIPISDTLFAIIRRIIKKQPPFQADKEHLHHQLLKRGLTHKQTVWIIWLFSSILSIGAIFSLWTTVEISVVLLIFYATIFQYIAKRFGILPK